MQGIRRTARGGTLFVWPGPSLRTARPALNLFTPFALAPWPAQPLWRTGMCDTGPAAESRISVLGLRGSVSRPSDLHRRSSSRGAAKG